MGGMDNFYIDGAALSIVHKNGAATMRHFVEYCGDVGKADRLVGDLLKRGLVRELPPCKSVLHVDGGVELNNEKRYELNEYGEMLLGYYLMERAGVV